MCFGPVASFTASGVLASIGVVVIRNIRSKKEVWFAAFPVLFAVQQFIEGVLWIAIRSGQPEALRDSITFVYLVFAYSLWPVLCPVSVYSIEHDRKRKRGLSLLILIGVATSVHLLVSITVNPGHAVVMNHHLRYETYANRAYLFAGVYMVAAILPYFLSSHRAILIFGVPNLIFCMVAYVFYYHNFTSMWCFFAAILSLTLYFFLKRLHHQPFFPPTSINRRS